MSSHAPSPIPGRRTRTSVDTTLADEAAMVSSEQCVVCLRVGVQVVGDSTVAHDELSSVQRVTHPRLAFSQQGAIFLVTCMQG